MTALQWIVKEAKKLKREYPKRFKTWREYVAQASAIYASKHKGKSPVGKKHAVKKKAAKKKAVKKVARKKVGAVKIQKYKLGQKVYSYQNKDYSAPINRVLFSPWDSSGKSHKNDTYKYKLSLKDGDSNWIDEKSISKKRNVWY